MKRLFYIILCIAFLVVGFLSGVLFTVYKYGSSSEVKSMNINIALPLKAEQVSSGLKNYFSLWKGRLQAIAMLSDNSEEISQILFSLEPEKINYIVVCDSTGYFYYPDEDIAEEINFSNLFSDLNPGYTIFLNPLMLVYNESRIIFVVLNDGVLRRRIAFQTMASSATPFWVGLFKDDSTIFSSEDEYLNTFLTIAETNEIFNNESDTGSVWEDTSLLLFWKKFNLEDDRYTVVITNKGNDYK